MSKEGLNPQQAKYIEGVTVKGLSKRQAAREAGYSPTTSSMSIEASPLLKNALVTALNARGLTEQYVAKKLFQGTQAYDQHYFTHQGKVVSTRKTVDFATRERYLRTTLELQGYLKNNTIENLNIGLIAIPQNVDPNAIGWNEAIKEGAPKEDEHPL